MRALHRLGHSEMLHLWICKHLVDAENWSARNTGIVHRLNELLHRELPGLVFHNGAQLRAITTATARGIESSVLVQFFSMNHFQECPPLVIAGCRNVDDAVGSGEHAGGEAGWMIVAGLWRHLVSYGPARRLEVEHGNLRFE